MRSKYELQLSFITLLSTTLKAFAMMRNITGSLILLFAVFRTVLTEECKSRDFGNGGTVCVCSADCDFIAPVEKVDPPNCLIYSSNLAGLRFSKSEANFSTGQAVSLYNIFVVPSRTYQTITGFGGTFSDAAGMNIKSLQDEVQQNLLKSYFGPDSIGYTLARVPIGASDFSTRLYTYDDSNVDPQLTQFKLVQEDFDYKIPFIKQAFELSNNLKLIGSAWTCPNWMKYTKPYGYLRDDMYQPWADYYLKFLDAYKENDIDFWGITTGNEPSVEFEFVPFPTLSFPGPALSRWIANYFGPAIRDSNYSSIKILTLDDQKTRLPFFIDQVFALPPARQYIDGVAIHWRSGEIITPAVLEYTHEHYPDKFLIGTEATFDRLPWEPAVFLGSWKRGEEYAIAILEDLRHWLVGWIDGTLALNVQGGPHIQSKFVDSPIIVNTTSGEFYKQPMYYAIGHFSKFIPPGSIMIDISQFDESVRTIGFKRPDGGIVINIINLRGCEVDVTLIDRKKGEINLHLTKHSINSVLYW